MFLKIFFLTLILFLPTFLSVELSSRKIITPSFGLADSDPESAEQPAASGKVKSRTGDVSEDLLSLSYLQGYRPVSGQKNVTIDNKKLAFRGLSLYLSGHGPTAFLIDMEGHLLHKWRYDLKGLSPDWAFWGSAHLFENGDLLAVNPSADIIKINKDSSLIWRYNCNCHHDLDVDSSGHIYALERQPIEITITDKANGRVSNHKIFNDLIAILSPDGKLIKKISILDAFKKSPYASFLEKIDTLAQEGTKNVFHANTVEVFDGHLSHISPLYRKGNILISMLGIKAIAILDLDREKIVWVQGPDVWSEGVHDPTLLENGNILLFENKFGVETSRVLEWNPLTGKVVWQYEGNALNRFYSSVKGANQRLPNNNTLIVESTNGRAFEVTPDGNIVWEFFNPHAVSPTDRRIVELYGGNEKVATLFGLIRLKPDFPVDWLKPSPGSSKD